MALAAVDAYNLYYPSYQTVIYPTVPLIPIVPVVPGVPVRPLVLPPQAPNLQYIRWVATWPTVQQPIWFVNWQRLYNVAI